MYPFIVIALGIAVLLFGNRLAILGAAVGGLVGAVLLPLFPEATATTQLLIVLGLALAGFFAAAFARGVIEVVILVVGALAGAAIVLGLLDLFRIDQGLLNWLLALVGGVIGLMLIRRSRRGSRDWGMVILADLVGALLVLRGLVLLFPSLQNTTFAALILLALLAGGLIFQGGFLRGRKAAPPTTAPLPPSPAVATTPPVAAVPPAVVTPPPPPAAAKTPPDVFE